MVPRKSLAAAMAIAALALPAAALAQSAGDQQYQDPLAGQGGGGSSSPSTPSQPSGSSGSSGSQAPAAPAPSTSSGSTAPAPAATGSRSVPLARTGFDAWILIAVGLALIAAAGLLVLPRRQHD
jgi:LPXTG-motif cell wall-anchored protein